MRVSPNRLEPAPMPVDGPMTTVVPLFLVAAMTDLCSWSSPLLQAISSAFRNAVYLAKLRYILPENGSFHESSRSHVGGAAVAEAGSLSAAARRQKTPLATVSRKVSELSTPAD